jgi:hypothetical protein
LQAKFLVSREQKECNIAYQSKRGPKSKIKEDELKQLKRKTTNVKGKKQF